MITKHEQANIFEDEVRRVARCLWPNDQYGGAAMIDGRERDGIFETEECVHLLEATISREKSKAFEDIQKLEQLAKKYASKNKPVQCWFVTRDEPTAHQRDASNGVKIKLNVLSFAQFQTKLVDARGYIAAREEYPFGSARDLETGSHKVNTKYVELDISCLNSDKNWAVDEIVDGLLSGKRFLLFGDFGAGKSMTLREAYIRLKEGFLKNTHSAFPIYLNLRDHQGQKRPSEILLRHSSDVGFHADSQLIRAWRAGYVVLILDGLDELGVFGVQGLWRQLRSVRYSAMEAIRKFISETPMNVGVLLAGREHFFDNIDECRSALGLTTDWTMLTLNDFNDAQIEKYLDKFKVKNIPEWLPTRPLLLGHLVVRGLLKAEYADVCKDPVAGWDYLLDKIAEREAQIEIDIDATTVRQILERLATKARRFGGGLGPIRPDDLDDAFQEVCGYKPNEKSLVLLQRLPGLGITSNADESRSFMDSSFADACRSGDVVRYIDDPFAVVAKETFIRLEVGLSNISVGMVARNIGKKGFKTGKLRTAINKSKLDMDTDLLCSDLLRVAMERSEGYDTNLYVNDLLIPEIDLSTPTGDVSRIEFVRCLFKNIFLSHEMNATMLPKFRECLFYEVHGATSINDLPKDVFDDACIFEEFMDVVETVKDILDLDLSRGTRVCLTILKKIFLQRGHGRVESALYRGLDHESQRLVGAAIQLLETEGIIVPYRRKNALIWQPVKRENVRVREILTAPHRKVDDPIVVKSAYL